MKTTLNKIREHNPCARGWEKLLKHLGKTQADDEPISIATILDSNGLQDALWCLRAVEGCDKEIRLFAVWCASQVQHLMKDQRSIDALDVAERYANGEATEEELEIAREAANAAYTAAARDAAWAVSAAAYYARAADSAAMAAARDAAWAAAASAASAAALYAARDAAAVRAEMESRQEAQLRRICEEG